MKRFFKWCGFLFLYGAIVTSGQIEPHWLGLAFVYLGAGLILCYPLWPAIRAFRSGYRGRG